MYNYSESINLLINKFPKLKLLYYEEVDYYEDLPYVFYENVFVKYITDKVFSYDESELKNIFNFIEDMLLNGDSKIRNLIGVAIIESLYYEKNFIEIKNAVSMFYGKITKKSFEDCCTN